MHFFEISVPCRRKLRQEFHEGKPETLGKSAALLVHLHIAHPIGGVRVHADDGGIAHFLCDLQKRR